MFAERGTNSVSSLCRNEDCVLSGAVRALERSRTPNCRAWVMRRGHVRGKHDECQEQAWHTNET